MKKFNANIFSLILVLSANKSLLKNLIQREILGKYSGSLFGILWSFIIPIFMLVIYTFVFSVIFKARWLGGTGSKVEFALILFLGLIVFNLFSECIGQAPSLILGNVNYVKKIIFPLEILPIVKLASALFHMVVSLLIWLLFYLIFIGAPTLKIVLLPFILLPYCFFILGLSWGLSSLGVFLRDISQIIGVLLSALMFLSPIFYSASSLPEPFGFLMNLNPLTMPIEMTRNLLMWGELPRLAPFLIYSVFCILTSALGFSWFQLTRKGFADVI